MSAASAITPLEVFTHCSSHTELLRAPDTSVVVRLRVALRQWKKRKRLPTAQAAFESYHEHLKSTAITSAKTASSVTLAPVTSASADVDALRSEVAQLRSLVGELRGLVTQQRTPTPLKTKLIPRPLASKMHTLSIVGDGRCLFYSLLQSQHAMLPIASEADALRTRLRQQLLHNYTDAEWEQRVPGHMRDTLTRLTFAERCLSRLTAHAPHDCAALWQDIYTDAADAPDVYILEYSAHDGEKVERIKARLPARHAIMLRFTWNQQFGHYELLTCGDVIRIPVTHELIHHLDEQHEQYVQKLLNRKPERRKMMHRRGKRQRGVEDEVVLEDDASDVTGV